MLLKFFRLSVALSLLFSLAACDLLRSTATIEVVANTSLTAWLTPAVAAFNRQNIKTPAGQVVQVKLTSLEAGQAAAAFTKTAPPALWIPETAVWAESLVESQRAAFQSDCVSVAQSPLVIAMWRPIAEALGWPGRSLGWLDVGSLAADASAWQYYSGGQFGPTLRLGHTHPGLSSSGAETLLAIVQAALQKKDAVNADDIQQPIVQASVGAFESAVSWFSQSTDTLGKTMRERGMTYLGVTVAYENTVLQYGAGDPSIVPIYPFEGTFMATHPACVNTAATAEAQAAAKVFRDYLVGNEAQALAIANGLRPVNTQVPLTAPLDAAHGVDFAQPQIVWPTASFATMQAAQTLWQSARKSVNMVMLLDTSGSMAGNKIKGLRTAAAQFVEQMGDRDYLTVIGFSDKPVVLINHVQVGSSRGSILQIIRGLSANGATTLYDALGMGAERVAATNAPDATNIIIALTDGLDTASRAYKFGPDLVTTISAHSTSVFTIAYGGDADKNILSDIAAQTNGTFYLGDETNIAEIYGEMSTGFGGNVGVGR